MGAIIFDLDNTLYDAGQFFSGAFKGISKYLSDKCRISKQEIYNKLMAVWKEKTSMYPHLFDDVLEDLGLENELGNVMEIFNKCNVMLEPHKDTIPVLRKLKKLNYKTGIITDGNVDRQRQKLEILGFADLFDVIVYSMEFNSPKPSEIPYIKPINRFDVDPHDSFYIGDNPVLDFKGAKKIGMNTIRLLQGEYMFLPKNEYIDYEIKKIKEIFAII